MEENEETDKNKETCHKQLMDADVFAAVEGMVKYVADQVTKEQVRMVVDDMLNNVTDQVTKEEKFRPKKVESVNIQDNTNANAIKEESILVHEDDNTERVDKMSESDRELEEKAALPIINNDQKQQEANNISNNSKVDELLCEIVDIQSMVIATDDDLPSERGSPIIASNCSSPLAFRKGLAVSPIDEPELDYTTDTVDCDSLVSDPERASGVERDNEEFPNLPIRTDQWKLYKVKHAGATYFLKADKAQFSPECLPEKSMEISLMECRGCRFKMPDVTSVHKCVANFCSLCQLATDNMQLHVLEHHSKNLTTCPFCQEDTSSLQLLEVHLSRHTQLKIRPSVCIGCKVKFVTSEGRIGHSCSSTLICKDCNTIFPSEEKLSNHQVSQHKKVPTLPSEAISEQDTNFETDGKVDGENDMGSYVCDFCDKKFTTRQQLDHHVSWHTTIPTEGTDEIELLEDFGKGEKMEQAGHSPPVASIRCPHCTLTLADTKELNKHLLSSKFCHVCLKQLGGAHEFEAHMVEFHCCEKMCQFCDALFEDSNLLIEHVKVHTRLEIRPFSCGKCESRFSKKEIWSSHKCQGKGNSPNLVCRDCKIYFQCEKTKDMHLIAHHAEHSNCPICKCSSESMPELLEHVKTHFNPTSQLSVVCAKCMASFADDKAFYNHCCGVGFKGFQDVEVIEFSSDTEQMVACSICGKEFSSEEELEAHVKQAVGDALQIAKEKLCRSCNVTFAVRSSFEAHIIQRHLSSLQCGFCMKYFASRRAMEQHLLHHTNIHRHPRFCNACSKMYFSDGLYENHSCESTTEEEDVPKSNSPIHDPLSEEPLPMRKLYFCPVCNTGFKGKRYLEDVHIPTHTQKVFTCNICSRQLQTVETLTQHLLCHAELDRAKTSPVKDKQLLPMLVLPQILVPEEKKRCWPCRRVFPSEEELSKHKIVHQYSAKVMDTTDRRISCKLCSSKFESEIWLAQHYVDKHHIMSALRYPCNLCNISYPTLVDRSKHLCRKNLSNKYEIFWDRVEVKDEPVESQAKYFYKAALSIDHPCIHCGDNFVNQIALISHQIYERFCVECKTTFKDVDMFQQHRMYAHVSLEFCTFCRQLMTSRSKLIQHLRSHTALPLRAADSINGYVYRCRNCKEVFRQKLDYDKHNIQNHFVGKKICPFCHEIFGTHREMAVHSKVHCNFKQHTLQPKPVKPAPKSVKAAPKSVKLPQKAASISQKPAKAPQKPVKITPKAEKTSSQSRSGPPEKKLTEKVKMPAPAKEMQKAKKTDSPALTKKSAAASDAASVASSKTVVPTFKAITMKGNRCSACRESVSSLRAFYEHVMELHFENPLRCPFCEKKTKLVHHMNSHLRLHKNVFCAPEPSQSADCTDSSSDRDSNAQPKTTKQSLKNATSQNPNKCPLCSLTFNSQALLNGHIRTSHRLEPAKAQLLVKTVGSHQKSGDIGPDKNTFCRHCHTSFETHGQLRAHAIKAMVFCEFCKITLADTKEFEMHMLEEHPMDDTCQFCGAYIPDREGLVIHIRKHTSMGPILYKCFGCNLMFSSVNKKNDHPCSAYACPKCSEPQNGPDGLEEHLKAAHSSPEPKAPAQFKAVKRSNRQSHTPVRGKSSTASVEIGQPPQKKPKSNEATSDTSTQKSDSRKVTSTMECGHCNGVFASKDSLTRHAIAMRLYCKGCKKCFAAQSEKEAHTCALTAGKVSTSNQHQIPYVCRFCGDQFTTFTLYEAHSKNHVVCQCDKCFKVFDSLKQLESHKKDHDKPIIKLESDSDSEDDIQIVEETCKKSTGAQFVLP